MRILSGRTTDGALYDKGKNANRAGFWKVMRLEEIRCVSSKKNIVSLNIHRGLFSLMDLLTLEAGINRLSWNVGKELPPYAGLCLRRLQIAHDLALLALVGLHMLRFSSALHAQIKDNLTYLSAKLKEKNLVIHLSKYSIFFNSFWKFYVHANVVYLLSKSAKLVCHKLTLGSILIPGMLGNIIAENLRCK